MSGRPESVLESAETAHPALSALEKAHRINLDAARYGTFAEIGAGQEVVRWFFQAGGAARTIAKTISAYDMAVSDAMYGTTDHYVSRKRLHAMLDCEATLQETHLHRRHAEKTSTFVFADTAATRGPAHHWGGHAWLGIRFQTEQGAGASEVILHAHLPEKIVVQQQEALGILGVNLIYGAFYWHKTPKLLIASLRDGLTRERVEIDMIKFSGPAFTGIDQRLMTLQLVKQGLTDMALSTAEGEVVQPSEVLYKRPILVERGSFRPITRLTLDMLESAREQFLSEPRLAGEEPVVLMEMTLHNLETAGDHQDFLDRAELLHTVGSHVLISNCDRYFSLVEILSQYTDKMIGIALGVPAMRAVGDEQYYVDLAGGRLEAIGRMFKSPVKFYVYPTKESGSDKIVTAENITFPPPFEHLHAYLLEGGHVEGLRRYDESYLNIHTPEVLAAIQAGDPRWEAQVPPAIVQTIKERELFGYRSNAKRSSS